MNEQIKQATEWIKNSENIVFFGGAGVSTESGIPDFRSDSGIYHKKYFCEGKEVVPEQCLHIDFVKEHPEIFYDYYLNEFLHPHALPNETHRILTKLEKMGKCKAIITQNVDGLHQKSGSVNVLEIHGTTATYSCQRCHKKYRGETVLQLVRQNKKASCDCGGLIRPDIVFYGEALPYKVFEKAIDAISHCDVLIVAGTSLNVYPAASLIQYYQGKKCILINLTKTPYDAQADIVLHEKCSNVFKMIENSLDD